ncbi:MAG TPA: hypothetical protein VE596_04445 [Gaiellaceae bacterium]|jgi:hypothetical protein|nr:hypothetical protein [Gaiellaceae bacterium]
MHKMPALLAVAAVLAVAAPAPASVRLVGIDPQPAHRGNPVTLTARVSPRNVICSITVYYKSGPSHARGVEPRKRAVGGRVSWTWLVGTRTTPGRWPIVVACGHAGTLRTSFRVV